ncbi:protein kinase [Anaerolineales bacterium HSG6]|nr:protein kinase [Anaerolineales bacterium HSG6]
MAKLINLPGGRPVNDGERLVVQYLRDPANLPDSYTIIPNAEIAQRGHTPYEYDLIVIAPHAIYVIEIKQWRGGISGDDYTWLVNGQFQRQNPLKTTNNKARVLKSQIERRQPALGQFWVEALVVIVDDQGTLDLHGQCRERVFLYPDLPDFLRNTTRLGHKATNLKQYRAYIEAAVQQAARGRSPQKLRFGDYEVKETLVQYEHVTEYLAHNMLLQDNHPVRVRVFSYDPYLMDDELARHHAITRREAQSLQAIGAHPNLIHFRNFFSDHTDRNLFVEVTDWSDGGTLRNLLNSDEPRSLERTLELAYGIAAGLKAVHDSGIIHRDLRPENILIDETGQPRLMNFDQARLNLTGARTVGPIQAKPGESQAYMAPELLDFTHTPTSAVDLYSLGVILFELLIPDGALQFDNPIEALEENTLLGGPASLGAADIPDDLNELVRQLAHPNLKKRLTNTNEALTRLQTIRDKPSNTQADPEPPPPPKPVITEVEPHKFEVSQIIDGKYQVQAVLQAGGSGQVYKVFDDMFSEVFALKTFNDSALSVQFLQQELRILKQLSHPNIVTVSGWGRLSQSKRLYMVLEYADGEDLANYITPEKHLSVSEAVQLILDLLSALIHLHPDVDRLEELDQKKNEGEITAEEFDEYQRLPDEGWYHRDIKPQNLMLTAAGVKLIDFNISANANQAFRTQFGTPGYMLPDTGFIPWSTEGDLFATGIVLYELITGHHPYPDRQPNAQDDPIDPRKYIKELRPKLVEILLQATSCDPAKRYRSATRFQNDLKTLEGEYLRDVGTAKMAAKIKLADWEQEKVNYNPYVTRLLTLYSQAERDNSGTRGLGEMAQQTYVETMLDLKLRPAVLDGQYQLVIITGNAGDGKTAFIQNMEQKVKHEGVVIESITDNSSQFTYQERTFLTNYDGSQDEGAERANDQVLTEFFNPFQDEQFDQLPNGNRIHLIAINEGRLVDFFGSQGYDERVRKSQRLPNSVENYDEGVPKSQRLPNSNETQFQNLGQIIINFFDEGVELPPWLVIIDLNKRSVVAQPKAAVAQLEGEPLASIFERQLQALLKPEFWTPCQSCALKNHCFIKFNVDSLGDPLSGPAVQERLRTLFEIVHLRRQLHITMRDMRSALSWLIFRDHSCDDIDQRLADRPKPDEWLTMLYYNAYGANVALEKRRSGQSSEVFETSELSTKHSERFKDDRLVALLRQIDPAQVANPELDRKLHFQGIEGIGNRLTFEKRSQLLPALLNKWKLPYGWQAGRDAKTTIEHQRQHAMLRRIAFFERRGNWKQMLPYQNLSGFRDFTQNSEVSKTSEFLKTLIIKGISLSEGVRRDQTELAENYICLRASQNSKGLVKSLRLFPIDDFALYKPPLHGTTYLEYIPDHLILRHQPQNPTEQTSSARAAELVVSLDLLELLMQIGNGFTPSLDDTTGIYLNLIIFRNALAHLHYRQVLLTRDERQFYQLDLDEDAVITLRKWESS